MYQKNQPLHDWVVMLDNIYGGSQNYAKTPYEIHAHLTEVCGIFAKHLFKKNDYEEARRFLPKIFAWATALLQKVQPGGENLEGIVLRKFPGVCPYCLSSPCACWEREKPTLNDAGVRAAYYANAQRLARSVNDFQLMFKTIYSRSWAGDLDPNNDALEICRRLFIRLVEELAEVGEALRFHHLLPENFQNELSDFLAWWFAILSSLPQSSGTPLLAEDCLWEAYPGRCPDCQMVPCLCRPGPVRQLMSRPVPGHTHRFDLVTSLLSQAAYEEDRGNLASGSLVVQTPIACVLLDLDHFKTVNDTHGHGAGDEALRHVAQILRRTLRERDWIYRRGGDEFVAICSNFTEEEAAGMMRRVNIALAASAVKWVPKNGVSSNFLVSASIGVSEIDDLKDIELGLENADKAAYASKDAGRNRVTLHSSTQAVAPAVEAERKLT